MEQGGFILENILLVHLVWETGTMYVADKTPNVYGNKKSFGNSGSSSGKVHSFEDYVTSFINARYIYLCMFCMVKF